MTELYPAPDPAKIKYPDLPRDVHLTEEEYFAIKREFYDINPIQGSGLFGQWGQKLRWGKFLKQRLKERNVSVEGYTFS